MDSAVIYNPRACHVNQDKFHPYNDHRIELDGLITAMRKNKARARTNRAMEYIARYYKSARARLLKSCGRGLRRCDASQVRFAITKQISRSACTKQKVWTRSGEPDQLAV